MTILLKIKQKTNNMIKKILYIDLDGVVADFSGRIKELCPGLETSCDFPDYESREKKVNEICEAYPTIFHELNPIEGAVEAVNRLFKIYDVYFLSVPMWNVPLSFTGKRIWVEKHFGEKAEKRLILTHRKDLNIGAYLIDDRLKHGVEDFKGTHVHFGNEQFPNWEAVLLWFEMFEQ